ncbi:hypothetical protein [Pedobacter cryoconitis]|uniref:DUF4595 domain-containing protein n=1 Tax=Pedobacter cryoconitis TaxID=188932 RepID=A0A327S1Y2_9SPHI|nr:hypothetical protein [Pedobacter cryoconitis]RAJ22871.1 hypothetical protein LY11_04673 [Pedobacter cryoconitis]
MEIYKKCLWIGSIFLLGCWGCKKKEEPVHTPETKPPVVEVGTRKLIPVQLGTGKSKVILNYTLQLAIQKITNEDGRAIVITYDQTGKPIELERFKNEEPVSGTSYELDEKGRVITGTTYKIKGSSYMQTGIYELDYNKENQVIKISYFDINNRKIAEQEKSYNHTGSLTIEKGITSSSNYDYDLKTGLFKQISYLWLLQLEKENNLFPSGMNLFLSGVNNIQLCNNLLSPNMQQSFSYIFNKDGYPETINATIDGVKSAVKVTYQEIK